MPIDDGSNYRELELAVGMHRDIPGVTVNSGIPSRPVAPAARLAVKSASALVAWFKSTSSATLFLRRGKLRLLMIKEL